MENRCSHGSAASLPAQLPSGAHGSVAPALSTPGPLARVGGPCHGEANLKLCRDTGLRPVRAGLEVQKAFSWHLMQTIVPWIENLSAKHQRGRSSSMMNIVPARR